MPPRCERLPNGLKAVLVPCEAQSVAVGLFVASGSRHEDRRHAGISHFIEHMLFKGTEKRSSLDITLAIEGRGGMFNAFTCEESTCFFAHMPDEYFAEAVDILGDMYRHAKIDPGEFAKEKQVVIEELRMYADEPDTVAMENLQKCLFPGHALGRPIGGFEETLRPLNPGEMKAWIKAHYVPRKTVVVVAGRFDEDKARKLLGKL